MPTKQPKDDSEHIMTAGRDHNSTLDHLATGRTLLSAAEKLRQCSMQLHKKGELLVEANARVAVLEQTLHDVLNAMTDNDHSANTDHPWIPGHAAKLLQAQIKTVLGVK